MKLKLSGLYALIFAQRCDFIIFRIMYSTYIFCRYRQSIDGSFRGLGMRKKSRTKIKYMYIYTSVIDNDLQDLLMSKLVRATKIAYVKKSGFSVQPSRVITRCPSSFRPSVVVNFSHFRLLL